MDLSLIRTNMILNRKKKNITYEGVNCYGQALNISFMPKVIHLDQYKVGCFSGKNTQHLQTPDLIANLESDLDALHVKYSKSLPICSLKKEDAWKIILFVKQNKNASFKEKISQIGGPNEIKDFHFIKLQDWEYSSKMGYKKPVQKGSYRKMVKELKRKGYNYVKTYKLMIK